MSSSAKTREIEIPCRGRRLHGILTVPASPLGIVVFAHGSGSGRRSERNQYVARVLVEAGMATLLMDLLEESEAADRRKVFDIFLLASSLDCAGYWLDRDATTTRLKRAIFGASTGAAAALVVAARQPEQVCAVVSRGGRPDLAGDSLAFVTTPTLLLVGGNDNEVLKLNRHALEMLRGEKELTVVDGATHLFSEPGALEQVAEVAANFLVRQFQRQSS
jgi:putative phosphoribosyl transferase